MTTQIMTPTMETILDKSYEYGDYPQRITDLLSRTQTTDAEYWTLMMLAELMMNGDCNSYERAFTYASLNKLDITGYPLGVAGRLLEGALGERLHIDAHCVMIWEWLGTWSPGHLNPNDETTDEQLKKWFAVDMDERSYQEYLSMLYKAVQNRYMNERMEWTDYRISQSQKS
jgi:hypothetical protein